MNRGQERDRHVPVAYGQGYTKICRLCGVRIWLCPQASGGWVALDLEPSLAGNVVLDDLGRAVVLARAAASETGFVVHQATCGPYLEAQRAAAHDSAQLRLGDDA